MSSLALVYDPTITDSQSKVRGIGRYLQILRENFKDEFMFAGDINSTNIKKDTILINPFFNILAHPLSMSRITRMQVAVIHDLIPLKYPDHFPLGLRGKLNLFLNKFAVGNYDRIITDSYTSKKGIVSLLSIPESKIKVVYPCLPDTLVNRPTQSPLLPTINNLSIPTPYCIYVGDATWNKNLVTIAQAIKLGDVPCVFVGKVFHSSQGDEDLSNPWQKELKEFFKLAAGDKRFIFPGFVKDEDLAALYQHALVNILVSRDEGFGFSYVEASLFGCPSILSKMPIFDEIASSAAEFVSLESPEEICAAIRSFRESPIKREKIGGMAKQQINKYDKRQFKQKLLVAIE